MKAGKKFIAFRIVDQARRAAKQPNMQLAVEAYHILVGYLSCAVDMGLMDVKRKAYVENATDKLITEAVNNGYIKQE